MVFGNMLRVETPEELAEIIRTSSLPLEVQLPSYVEVKKFRSATRKILKTKKLFVYMSDASTKGTRKLYVY